MKKPVIYVFEQRKHTRYCVHVYLNTRQNQVHATRVQDTKQRGDVGTGTAVPAAHFSVGYTRRYHGRWCSVSCTYLSHLGRFADENAILSSTSTAHHRLFRLYLPFAIAHSSRKERVGSFGLRGFGDSGTNLVRYLAFGSWMRAPIFVPGWPPAWFSVLFSYSPESRHEGKWWP